MHINSIDLVRKKGGECGCIRMVRPATGVAPCKAPQGARYVRDRRYRPLPKGIATLLARGATAHKML